MSNRFFYSGNLAVGEVLLTGTESHHLIHVMRAQPGTEIELFDGCGQSTVGKVSEVRRKKAVIEIENPQTSPQPEGLALAVAVPKGDRFRWLIEKATELGVTRLIPLLTERSVVNPRETKLKKMEQTVIAACKQSGRNWLMPIDEMLSLEEWLESRSRERPLIAAHPQGIKLSEAAPVPDSVCDAVIGPEGGLTDRELELIQDSGANIITLGDHILRTETAAIALAGWWRLTH